MLERALADPELAHVYIDISWDEVAKYLVATPEAIAGGGGLIKRYPDRFLFGTDEVAPPDQAEIPAASTSSTSRSSPQLDEKTRLKFCKGNYERLFDQARRRVRAWEAAEARRSPGNPAP